MTRSSAPHSTTAAPTAAVRRRGRPRKEDSLAQETRQQLLRAGLEMLTEKGYSAAGLDEILRHAGVPKGSFYHYFSSKEAYGQALIDDYGRYFVRKLDRWLLNAGREPLQRIADFIDDACHGMQRHEFRKGCLVGNLGQEIMALPESFRQQLSDVFNDWQQRLAACLKEAQTQQQLASAVDCEQLAAFFWTGWEGAVLRARLEKSNEPLRVFAAGFFQLISRS